MEASTLHPVDFAVSFPRPAFYLNSGIFDIPGQFAFAPQGRATNTYCSAGQRQLGSRQPHHQLRLPTAEHPRAILRQQRRHQPDLHPRIRRVESERAQPLIPGLPDASANDVNTANNLLSTLAGIISGYQQTFNVTSRTSGFVPFAANTRHFEYDTYSGYVTDKWKVRRRRDPDRRVTLRLLHPHERARLPVPDPQLTDGNYIATVLSNATLDFGGNSVGRPYYKASKKNFAPSLGFAWDVFGDGKTAVRGGYSLSYFNDDTIVAVQNYIGTNAGLQTTVGNPDVAGQLSNNPPRLRRPR